MNQKTKYTVAGVIFLLLLLVKVRDLLSLIRSFLTLPSFVWVVLGFIGSVLCLIPLIALTISAFKQKTNQKTKGVFAVMYILGVVLPMALSLPQFIYILMSMGFWLKVFYVVLFCVALFKLMQTPEEQAAEKEVEVNNERINYYKDLCEKGIITEAEFEQMKQNVIQGDSDQ